MSRDPTAKFSQRVGRSLAGHKVPSGATLDANPPPRAFGLACAPRGPTPASRQP
jgi:hypothetical protein